jgi:hypothetical protein
MKRLLYLIFFIPVVGLSQNREVYLSKDYVEDGKNHNTLFRFEPGVLIPYYCKSKVFSIDSLEEAGNMWPRTRIAMDDKLSSIFYEPVEQLIKYQDEVNNINDCETAQPPLIIYIKEGNIVHEIKIKDCGKCLNKIYLKKGGKLVDTINQSIDLLKHYAPG